MYVVANVSVMIACQNEVIDIAWYFAMLPLHEILLLLVHLDLFICFLLFSLGTRVSASCINSTRSLIDGKHTINQCIMKRNVTVVTKINIARPAS